MSVGMRGNGSQNDGRALIPREWNSPSVLNPCPCAGDLGIDDGIDDDQGPSCNRDNEGIHPPIILPQSYNTHQS